MRAQPERHGALMRPQPERHGAFSKAWLGCPMGGTPNRPQACPRGRSVGQHDQTVWSGPAGADSPLHAQVYSRRTHQYHTIGHPSHSLKNARCAPGDSVRRVFRLPRRCRAVTVGRTILSVGPSRLTGLSALHQSSPILVCSRVYFLWVPCPRHNRSAVRQIVGAAWAWHPSCTL